MRFFGLVGLGLLLWIGPGLAQQEIGDDFLDSFFIQAALERGQSVTEVATALMDAGHAPQLVAREILLLRPDSAIEVATTMARRSPQEAPFVAAAISWMADSKAAPVAAAVAAAVPEMAPEVASHVAAAFPEQTAPVARAVAEAEREQITTIATTMAAAVPENAAAVIGGIAPLLESPLAVVDFLVEVFAALPIPLAAFTGPGAGLVIAVTGEVEKKIPPSTPEGTAGGEAAPVAVDAADDVGSTVEPGETTTSSNTAAALPVGSGVSPRDILRTTEGGRVTVVLRDGTVLTLFEGSQLRFGAAPEGTGSARVQGGLEQGVLRVVGGGGETRSWRFDLGKGSLTVADADVLLARGEAEVGVVLLAGTAIWETSVGRTITLEPGRYRGDAAGELSRPRTDANVYDWLQALGLEDIELGDLAEQSVWVAARLGRAMDHGNAPGQVQAP